MTAFFLRRALQALLVVFGVSLLTFVLVRASGDPASLLLPLEATQDDVESMRRSLGLDGPWYVQYGRHVLALARGDLGRSITFRAPASEIVLERLPATVLLGSASLLFAVAVAVPLGILAAARPNTLVDRVAMSVSLLGQSVPVYWLGIMLILVFSVRLGWFPTGGRDGLVSMVLPMLTLSLYSMARTARMVRSSMIEVLSEDYVRTARAKGLRRRSVLLKHALRNAGLPVVTVIGLDLGNLLGGAVITETVFAWPGIGRLAVQAIYARDFPIVQAVVVVTATMYVVVNLAVDLLYAVLDPRVRYG